ncbi:MAG: class I SAM-dependent methyltransferase [Chloroflexi bacterium]|nr:class I SAM-dependent methyltransferase [Ktedonobacteraceae bacterium]MBV9709239.1 class I SAM-dependent methyltransferase [Chloroflexota bacterium]
MSTAWQPYDFESKEEVNRLLERERVLNELLRGPLPPGLDLPAEAQVLHIACGPGTWIYLLVLNHPSLQVTGIDKSAYFLQCARHYLAGLDNITLQEYDIRTERGFLPERTFDLVHLRFLAAELSPTVLPEVIADLVKSCKHGTYLYWMECEFPTTNCRPCEQLVSYILHALEICGRCYTPGCNALGITAYMSQWLRRAGCRLVQNQACALDISAGMPAHHAFVQQTRVLSQQLRPLIIGAGVVSCEVYDAVTVQALEEMRRANFCGVLFMRSMMAVAP